MAKRILVTLDDELYEILKGVKGFGQKDAEKINKIVVSFLSEHGYFK